MSRFKSKHIPVCLSHSFSGVEDSIEYEVHVINGFLKAVDKKAQSGMTIYHCWTTEQTYTAISYSVKDVTFDGLCSDDPGFYQNCGVFDLDELTSKEVQIVEGALCGLPICSFDDFLFGEQVKSGAYHHTRWHCNPNFRCNNFNNTEHCEGEWFWCESSDQVIQASRRCDGVMDCPVWSDDETGCEHTFGLECRTRTKFLEGNRLQWKKPHSVCINATEEGVSNCENGIDLLGSEACSGKEKVGTCTSSDNHQIDFYDVQRCGTQVKPTDDSVVCIDGSDHINCTNRDVVFNCTHASSGHTITLTDIVLCEDLTLCQDNLINKCKSPETNCKIHRHFICDGIRHCKNGLDESYCQGNETSLKCVRKIRNKADEPVEHNILKDWVLDGVQDCEDGVDEVAANWQQCSYDIGYNKTLSVYSYKQNEYPCNFTFVCNDTDSVQFLEPLAMCNGQRKASCEIEAQLCKIARNKNVSVKARSTTRIQKYLPTCIRGFENNDELIHCKDFILEESYGTTPIIISGPSQRNLDCTQLYGESYVYSACLGLCRDEDIVCPLTDIHFTRSCPYLPNRIMTLTKRGKLTFVEPLEPNGGGFVNREMFPCTNGRCVPYTQLCDLMNDCGDNSDEENCHNHFSCTNHKTEIIKSSQFCDGSVDCSDAADECSPHCRSHDKKILTSTAFQTCGWLIGIPATLMNVFMIFRNICHLFKEKKKVNYCIDALITVIAIGDFCVALYLLCISVENLMIGNEFCRRELEWLTSAACEFYGVLSTFGSQLSVFGITVLSVYRSYVIKKMRISEQRSYRTFTIKVVVTCALLIGLSLLIALLPTNINLKDAYFYNGYYIENAPLFLGSKRNNKFIPILDRYFGKDNMFDSNSAFGIRNKIKEMFRNSNDSRGMELKFNVLGFYGSSGLCTFKYFVDPHDPQKHYTWSILALNFSCFIIILVAYCSVQIKVVQSSNRVGHVSSNRFGPLQRKITFIILTDFLCKFPFLLLCFVHYTRIIDATGLYPGVSTILLPINTVINPLLYDKYLTRVPSWFCRGIAKVARIRKGKSEPDLRQTTTTNDFNRVGKRNPSVPNVAKDLNNEALEMQVCDQNNTY